MWLIVSLIAALVVTLVWLVIPVDRFRLNYLSLAFWGLSLMVFVDHVLGWLSEGGEGEFFEIDAGAFVLSLCMIVPILIVWEAYLVLQRYKTVSVKGCACENKTHEGVE